jgi:acetyltransferase-like isoleucine patch superfamily enzyme/dTDP-4-dehydrorhamnose 3,5-epimerase-like enzyme
MSDPATPGANYFRHPNALVESAQIGRGTRIWAFAHVLPGAVIGADCNICDHTFVENDVRIGDRVTVKCGVQLWDGISIEDDVFIGPNATFTNDIFPRSKQYPAAFLRTVVKKGASIGANATILPNLTIGERAMIGAGAVVTRNVPANAILAGNPARIVGYTSATISPEHVPLRAGSAQPSVLATSVAGVTLHRLPMVDDIRGLLSFGESGRHLPFDVKRYFLVYGVSSKEIRGEHAHKTLHQFLICVHGKCHVLADDGTNREEFVLDDPTLAVHLPPMTWGVQYKYSPDAVLLVFASGYYDPADYIRDYTDFLALLSTSS